MNRTLSGFVVGLLVGGLMATAGYAVFLGGDSRGTDGSGATVLKLAHALPREHPVHLAMVEMKSKLEEVSGGRMSLDIYPSGQLGGETECLEQVQSGALAMTKSSTAPLEGFVEEMKVFGLPYLFEDADHYWRVLEGDVGKGLLESGRKIQLLGLCYYDSGSRNFYTSGRMIKSPADLKGMKIRVQSSPVAIKMIEAMGGSPTPIAWGELYSALAQGTVDGAENNAPSYLSEKHCEVAPNFSEDGHTRVPDILLINTGVWDGLTGEQKSWMQEAASYSSEFQRKLWAEKSESALKEAVERFSVSVFEPDKQAFKDVVQPVYDEFAKGTVGELVTRIRNEGSSEE